MRSIGRSVRSVRSVCLKIFVLFELFVFKKTRVQKNLVFKMMSVQDDEWFICGEWIHVIGVTHDRCDTWF